MGENGGGKERGLTLREVNQGFREKGTLPVREEKFREVNQKSPVSGFQRLVAVRFASGEAVTSIAKGVSQSTSRIWAILRQPDVKAYLAEIREIYNAEMEALFGKVVETLREALNSSDHTIALSGAALHMKIMERLKGKTEEVTAEDVINRILSGEETHEG